jgi:hypothetical protein
MTESPSNIAYAVFAGPIDQAAVQRIFAGITTGTVNKVEEVHVLFHSHGGTSRMAFVCTIFSDLFP